MSVTELFDLTGRTGVCKAAEASTGGAQEAAFVQVGLRAPMVDGRSDGCAASEAPVAEWGEASTNSVTTSPIAGRSRGIMGVPSLRGPELAEVALAVWPLEPGTTRMEVDARPSASVHPRDPRAEAADLRQQTSPCM